MATILVRRGTRANLDSLAAGSGLLAGEVYWVTDENVLAVGATTSTYIDIGPGGGGGGGVWGICQTSVDTGQDVNTAATLAVTETANEGSAFTVVGNTVRADFTGWARIDYGIVFAGSVARAVPQIQIQQAGIPVPGLTARNTYIRNASGHTQSSANASGPVQVTSGDLFSVVTAPLAGTGTVTVEAESMVSYTRVT